ncbi:MAG: carbohydrate ABC transporter permease, partial [Mobilitalea sp.]
MSETVVMKKKKRILSRTAGDKVFSLALLIPAILTTIMFIIVPLVDSIYRSFFDYKVGNIISGKPGVWNNFDNYLKLFSNGKLPTAISNTLVFVIGVVIAQFVIGLALALILNTNMKAARLIRSIMMVPWVVPTVISGLIWMWMFQPQYGLVKFVIGIISGGRITDFAILNNPSTAMFGVS